MLLIFLVLITAVVKKDTSDESKNKSFDSEYNSNPMPSDNWILTSPIFVNDTDPSNNWATINSTYAWCNGAGTWNNPYVIENVTIDSQNSGSAITILNSDIPFQIRNCTIRNTGTLSEDAGIKLINVNNSKLSGNIFLDIDKIGIYLKLYCKNNTIKDNYIFEDLTYSVNKIQYGIYLYDQCSGNIIKENYLHGVNIFGSSDRGGVHLEDECNSNTIENNWINRSDQGIYLINKCDDNTLFNNTIINNDENGIIFENDCDANKLLNNTVSNNDHHGIYGYDGSDDNIIANNIVNDNRYNGIYIVTGCENNTIVNNIVNQNEVGIKIESAISFCQYFTIIGNFINNSAEYGIYIQSVTDVDLWENELYGCGFLIQSTNVLHHESISLSTNNTVNGKPVYYCVEKSGLDSTDFPNAGQIILIDCNHTRIENFEFFDCSIGIYDYSTFYPFPRPLSYNHTFSNITSRGNMIGIYSHRCHNLTMSDITAKRNEIGIKLSDCIDSNINNNTLNENVHYGLQLYDCNNTIIMNNYIQFTMGTVFDYGLSSSGGYSNKIINNTITHNAINGISLNGGKNHYISGNNISHNNKTGINFWSSNCDYHTIINNTISYNKEHGIYLETNCNYNLITNNTIYNNTENGIYLWDDCDSNNITLNRIYDNCDNGIFIEYNCDNNNLILNQIHNNSGNGIYITSTSINNYVFNNTIEINLQNGIYIKNANDNNITRNYINDNKQYGINIDTSTTISLSQNYLNLCGLYITGFSSQHYDSHQIQASNMVNDKKLCFYTNQNGLVINVATNPGQVILINCSDSIISNANVSNGSIGIMLYLCENISIMETNSSYNKINGVYVKDSENCTLAGNIINYNGLEGIYVDWSCKYINFTGNYIRHNSEDGIHLEAPYCIIDLNQITNNGDNGIYIFDAANINITRNTIENNVNDGIYTISWCDYLIISNNSLSYNIGNGFSSNDMGNYNEISLNLIINNQENGIYLLWAYQFNITGNRIQSNIQRGIFIDSAGDCQIWNNNFTSNGINALDNGITNSWDNGSIGNYWDDYTGGDNNGDGIGDTPYNVPGSALSIDNYPIWGIPPSSPIEAGGGSSGNEDAKSPSEINISLIILGAAIIGSIVAAYYAMHVYSNRYSSKPGKYAIKKEPLLRPPSEKQELSTLRPRTSRTSQNVRISSKEKSETDLKFKMDDFDQFFIQNQLGNISGKMREIYEELLRENSTIREYLESDVSVEDMPNGERLITTIIDDVDLRKIEKINLPYDQKKIFLMEIISMNKKDRKRLLDEMLENA